jgi:hypothetical protein
MNHTQRFNESLRGNTKPKSINELTDSYFKQSCFDFNTQEEKQEIKEDIEILYRKLKEDDEIMHNQTLCCVLINDTSEKVLTLMENESEEVFELSYE